MIGSIGPDLAAAFAAGLFGSLHCIGMCGPLASLGCRAGMSRREALGPLLFVSGKLVSYAALGLAVGFAGAALARGSAIGRMTAYISLGGGVLMLAILLLARFTTARGGLPKLSVALAKVSLRAGRAAPLLLGVAAALLPCGLLYAMVARSAASGAPVVSMGLMTAFGLGTSPALLGIGALLRALPQKWSRYGAVAGEVVLALTALGLVWRGVMGLMAAATGHSCCH